VPNRLSGGGSRSAAATTSGGGLGSAGRVAPASRGTCSRYRVAIIGIDLAPPDPGFGIGGQRDDLIGGAEPEDIEDFLSLVALEVAQGALLVLTDRRVPRRVKRLDDGGMVPRADDEEGVAAALARDHAETLRVQAQFVPHQVAVGQDRGDRGILIRGQVQPRFEAGEIRRQDEGPCAEPADADAGFAAVRQPHLGDAGQARHRLEQGRRPPVQHDDAAAETVLQRGILGPDRLHRCARRDGNRGDLRQAPVPQGLVRPHMPSRAGKFGARQQRTGGGAPVMFQDAFPDQPGRVQDLADHQHGDPETRVAGHRLSRHPGPQPGLVRRAGHARQIVGRGFVAIGEQGGAIHDVVQRRRRAIQQQARGELPVAPGVVLRGRAVGHLRRVSS
jgi:hypothetical protein